MTFRRLAVELLPESLGGPGIRLQVGHGLLKGRTKEVPKVTTGNYAVADHDELALKRLLLSAEAAVMRVWYNAGGRVKMIKHKCRLRRP